MSEAGTDHGPMENSPGVPDETETVLIWDGQMVTRTAAGLSCYG
jgi:hypothetical protein